MNIFCYHPDPVLSALWIDDRRKNKMILESAQLLSTTVRWIADFDEEPPVYKRAYFNHPCARWVRESSHNMAWLVDHMQAMVTQKSNGHKSAKLLPIFRDYLSHENWSQYRHSSKTPFANCARNVDLGIDFTWIADVHEAYRLYHVARWETDSRAPTWKWGERPKWYNKRRVRDAC